MLANVVRGSSRVFRDAARASAVRGMAVRVPARRAPDLLNFQNGPAISRALGRRPAASAPPRARLRARASTSAPPRSSFPNDVLFGLNGMTSRNAILRDGKDGGERSLAMGGSPLALRRVKINIISHIIFLDSSQKV